MIFETFAVGSLACNCTILGDPASGEAIVVDGGDGVDQVLERLAHSGLRATHLLHTHAHIDHIGDLGRLRQRTGAAGFLHPDDLPLYHTLGLQAQWIRLSRAPAVVTIDGELHDGDRFTIGNFEVGVLHTPGHTPGSVCFHVSHNGERPVLLTGDTLFAGSIGRWDLGGTSMEDIVFSIRTKLLDYPDDAAVIPGHGPMTTIGTERTTNPYLR